jgi:hypothetical protein
MTAAMTADDWTLLAIVGAFGVLFLTLWLLEGRHH